MPASDKPEWRLRLLWSTTEPDQRRRAMRGPFLTVDGATVPSAFPVDCTADGMPEVHLTVAYSHEQGRWVAEDVHLVPSSDVLEVTPDAGARVFRDLSTLVTEAVVLWTHQQAALTAATVTDSAGTHMAPLPVEDHEAHHEAHRTRQRRRDITPQLLAEVAEVYRANPGRPTAAVAEHFYVSKATASRWVKAARTEGVLD